MPEEQVLVGCGRAPRGRLARVRSGVGLRPYILDGPELPVGPKCVWPGARLCACAHVCVRHESVPARDACVRACVHASV